MELTIKDRLYLPSFLPARGNFKEFNLKKEILRKIAISDDERQESTSAKTRRTSVSNGTWKRNALCLWSSPKRRWTI